MKTIPILLLLLTSLSAIAAPEFSALPGTPEYLNASGNTNQNATPVYVPAARPVARPAVAPVAAPAAKPAASIPAPAFQSAPVPAAAPAVDSFSTPNVPVRTPPATQMVPAVKPVPAPVVQAQTVTRTTSQTVTPTLTNTVSKVVTQTISQAAPPTMPASMRPAPGSGFGMIKTGNSTPPATTPPANATPTVLTHTPKRAVPSAVTPANSGKPIEMEPATTAPEAVPEAAAQQNAAPVVTQKSTPAPVVAANAVAAPVAAPVAISAAQLAVPVAQPMTQQVTQPVTQSFSQPIVQPIVQPVVQAVAQPAAQPVVQVAPVVVAAPSAPPTMPPGVGQRHAAQNPVPAAPVAAPMQATQPPPARETAAGSESIPAGVVRFQNAPLEQVLEYYSDMVKRTLLRPSTLPTASITINTKTDLTRDEVLQALDSVLGLNGIAMIPVGQKFMKVVPIAQANQEAAPLNADSAAQLPELGQYVTHVVQLKYSKPSELATVLQQFAKVPNSVFPIDSNQILILRDYTENVKRMLEMIDRIDVSVPSEFVSEVIPIKYALADDIQSALSSISGSGGGTGSTGGRSGTSARPLAGTQNSLSPTSGGGAYGNNNNGNRSGLGNTGGTGGTGGANGAAGAQQTFAQRLQSIVQRASASGGDIQLIGPNKIIADERTNSLLVFATREDMATIKDIISKLDVVLAQVLIEAIILDVSLGDTFNLGVSAGQRPSTTHGSSYGGLINNANGQLAGNNSFLNQLISSNITSVAADGVTNVTTVFSPANSAGITYPSGDGLNYFGTLNNKWDFSLSALAGNNNVKVLARPRIQTSHAVAANIFVGETRPYITGTYFDSGVGGSSRSQYQQTQIGISLNVLPLINTEGLVVMDIQQQVQQVGGSVTIDGNQVPITQDQSASAKVAVNTGETIVLGGFIQNQKSDSQSGVPLLKDIPLLGALFRTTATTSNRRELLVLIRPTVLPTPSVAALQPDIERNRLPGIRQAEAEFSKDQTKRNKKISNKKPVDLDSQ